ncbi:hypothetical protein ABOM_001245 [Aspergillus bombycis]|uniref:Major facilitator superfamily (MFS) profile domain-containing protein n=1 Tax=Aspergillus bombycis TaxID=109264 RepID=A0A1F8AEG2_9EURO|nr:hypothetical protein ABOM_001245 [Aspergillus bombycis]OGM50082.1 hypothetical protein ABOM_001245 [Aspergillus bombycis]
MSPRLSPDGGERGNSDSEAVTVQGPTQQLDDDDYAHGVRLSLVFTALLISDFLSALDMSILATAIPKITDEFHGLNKVSWYSAVFWLTSGGSQSAWGKAYKYFPLKSTFLVAITTFEVGSLICGVAPNSTALILGRAIAGLGAAGNLTGVYTIIAFTIEPRVRARFTGAVGMAYGVAAVLGPLIGGAFSDRVSWRWCFYINLPIGGIVVLIILFFLHVPARAQPVKASWKEKILAMDPVGCVLVMGALVSYMLALQYGGQTMPWSNHEVVGLIVGWILILIVFCAWEVLQGELALIIPRLICQGPVGISALFIFFLAAPYFVVIYYLPVYFQGVHGTSAIMSGVDSLPLVISTTLAMLSAGIFVSATGIPVPLQIVGAALATIASGLLYTLEPTTNAGPWIGYQIIGGVGWGMSFQLPIIIAQSSASPQDMSSITAIILCESSFCPRNVAPGVASYHESTITEMSAVFQNIGATTFNTAAQAAFVNTIASTLATTAPKIDPQIVVQTGATEIRATFNYEDVGGIIMAYMEGIKSVMAICIASSGMAFLVGILGLRNWKNQPRPARKEKRPSDTDVAEIDEP